MGKYTVWAGGIEICDFYVTKSMAFKIAAYYRLLGYDDIQIEKV